jgi:hypothetical protein
MRLSHEHLDDALRQRRARTLSDHVTRPATRMFLDACLPGTCASRQLSLCPVGQIADNGEEDRVRFPPTTNLVKSSSIHKRAITNRLWRYRKERQLSQRHARLLGHRTTAQVSRWESGAKIPTLDNALLLAHIVEAPCSPSMSSPVPAVAAGCRSSRLCRTRASCGALLIGGGGCWATNVGACGFWRRPWRTGRSAPVPSCQQVQPFGSRAAACGRAIATPHSLALRQSRRGRVEQ